MLVISYETRELAEYCNRLEAAQEWLGPADAQALVDLIADAEAMSDVQAFMEFYDIAVPNGDLIAVDFSPRYRAKLKAIGLKTLRDEIGQPIWKSLRRLMLVEVLKI